MHSLRVKPIPGPTEDDLVAKAAAMIPVLKSRADACEAARTMAPETIQDFRDAGFFKIMQPHSYGGYQMSPLTLVRVVFEIGRGDMAAAWVMFVLGLHQFEPPLIGEAACEAIWGDDADTLMASSLAPFGEATKVEGGYRVTGRWKFCSGVDHVQWVGVGALAPLGDIGQKGMRVFMVRKPDFEIQEGSWQTFGLCGTGSKDVVIDHAFVPEEMTHDLTKTMTLEGQDSLPPVYRFPFWVVYNAVLASAIVGGALGGLDEVVSQMRVRKSSHDSGSGRAAAADDPFVRVRIGRGAVLLRGAVNRFEMMFNRMERQIQRGETISTMDRMLYMAELGQCGKDAEDATLLLYKATGGRGLSLDNNMQAVLRNVLSGANHIAMNVDPISANLGATMLGVEGLRVPH
jgi:3-hydroxy-9,10-secoandrosta-1,3,5(10)-triene-9,17-dione monooxygenase